MCILLYRRQMLRFITLREHNNTLLSLATSYELKIPSGQNPNQANASMRAASSDQQKKQVTTCCVSFISTSLKD